MCNLTNKRQPSGSEATPYDNCQIYLLKWGCEQMEGRGKEGSSPSSKLCEARKAGHVELSCGGRLGLFFLPALKRENESEI